MDIVVTDSGVITLDEQMNDITKRTEELKNRAKQLERDYMELLFDIVRKGNQDVTENRESLS